MNKDLLRSQWRPNPQCQRQFTTLCISGSDSNTCESNLAVFLYCFKRFYVETILIWHIYATEENYILG